MLAKRTIVFVCVMFVVYCSQGQQEIERYLVSANLVTEQQLKKYHDKVKKDDEYVRLMIKLMKDKRMEKEYREELKKRQQKKDTLSILADILENGAEKKYVGDTASDQVKENFTAFVHQLKNKGLITEENSVNLLSHLKNSWLYDSTRIVKNAIGFRDKSALTIPSKLTKLSTLFKDLGLITDENYQKLGSELSVQKIVKAGDKVFVSANHGIHNIIKSKDMFDSYMSEFSRLTGLRISNAELKFNTLKKDSQEHRYNPVIEVYHNGKKYSYTCYEVMYTSVKNDPYTSGLDFYKIFNFILAGKNSPLRLHSITEKHPSDYIYTNVWSGFIMLTEPQAEGLYHNENVEISYEERLPTLAEGDIQRAVSIYRKAGIFDKVSQSTVDSVISDSKENPLFRYNELLGRFPAISLLINENEDITENEALVLVKRLAEISNYAFNPQNARFEKDKEGTTWFLIEINGKTYRERMLYANWTTAWSVVHNAVFSDLKRTGQFEVARLNPGQTVIIYVTPAQMKMLEKEKVVGDY